MHMDVCKSNGWAMVSFHSKLEQDFIGYRLLQTFYHIHNGFLYIGIKSLR